MMWSIAICDDNQRECYEVEDILETYCCQKNIVMETEIFHDGFSLYEKMEAGRRYDLIFLDILMRGMDGIQVGKQIRKGLKDEEVQIVYMSCVTGHSELLLQNRPLDFVRKPINKEEVYRAADSSRRLGNQLRKWFFYQKDRMVYQVPYKEILFFQSQGRKVEIHTVSGVSEFYGKLSGLIEAGLPKQFVQIHQSYIINKEYVVCVGKEKVFLKGQQGYFSISHPYRQSVLPWLKKDQRSDFVE